MGLPVAARRGRALHAVVAGRACILVRPAWMRALRRLLSARPIAGCDRLGRRLAWHHSSMRSVPGLVCSGLGQRKRQPAVSSPECSRTGRPVVGRSGTEGTAGLQHTRAGPRAPSAELTCSGLAQHRCCRPMAPPGRIDAAKWCSNIELDGFYEQSRGVVRMASYFCAGNSGSGSVPLLCLVQLVPRSFDKLHPGATMHCADRLGRPPACLY